MIGFFLAVSSRCIVPIASTLWVDFQLSVKLTLGIGTGWKNGEVRTYVFDRSSEAARERAAVKETEESIARRFLGEQHVPLTAQEQHDLRVRTERAWARDGYIDLSEKESSTEGNKVEILN